MAIDAMLSARAWMPPKTVSAARAENTIVPYFILFFFLELVD
jgi:hypothetical protein